jgi:hypothetical protein
MRHLLEVGDASAKAMAASITEETTAVEMAASFMEYLEFLFEVPKSPRGQTGAASAWDPKDCRPRGNRGFWASDGRPQKQGSPSAAL